MSQINQQAQELNDIIQHNNPVMYNLMSEKGRAFFFPKLGIVRQSADAKGKRINATIGIALEDDGSPVRLEAIASKIALDPDKVFSYASSYGHMELRKKWQQMIVEKNPSIDGVISLPVVTNALTHGLSVAGLMFMNPGDTILMPDKFWGNYKLIFESVYGAAIKTFNTFKGDKLDLTAMEEALSANPGKQIILLNYPNNPTGYSPTNEEMDAIARLLTRSADKGNEILVITDDAYFGLFYEAEVCRESIFARIAHAHSNILALKVDGATKEDYVWGLRVGFLTFASKGITPEACTALESKVGGMVRGTISNDSNLSQSLVLEALNSPGYKEDKRKKQDLLHSRYLKVREVLKENQARFSEVFTPLPFNSGYFMCVQLTEGIDAEAVRQTLLKEFDTGVISIGRMIRLAFSAVGVDTIPELFENLYQACKKNQ